MAESPNLILPYIAAAQAQKHATHNEALRLLDGMVQLAVVSRTLTVPPGSPVEGDRYIVASGATGAWATWDLNVAFWVDGAWVKLVQRVGWLAYSIADAAFYRWTGAAWVASESFSDATFQLTDDADPTKIASFQLSGITTGTTRTFTLPNTSATLAHLGADLQTFTGDIDISAATNPSLRVLTAAEDNVTFGLYDAQAIGSQNFVITFSAATSLTQMSSNGSTLLEFDAGTALRAPLNLGIGGATADATNRLSINSPAVLFNNAGTSIQATLNKNAAGNDAGLVFQTAASTRALFGTLGSDDFVLKVSPDGSSFFDAFTVARATGRMTVANGLVLNPVAADLASPVDGLLWYNSTTGKFRARQAGATVDVIDPWTYIKLAADNVVSTTGLADVAGMSFTALADTTYEIEIFGAWQSAATTTGIGIALDIPSGTVIGHCMIQASSTGTQSSYQRTDNVAQSTSSAAAAANLDLPISGKYVVAVGVTGGTIQLRQRSEVAASEATLKAGVRMKYRQIPA